MEDEFDPKTGEVLDTPDAVRVPERALRAQREHLQREVAVGHPLPATVKFPTGTLAMTPPELLVRALENGAADTVLEKLLNLQERWNAMQARKSFDAAIANAKAEIAPIVKSRLVAYESKTGGTGTAYKHETLADIDEAVRTPLAEHGLSYRWRTLNPVNERITVTCILAHKDGHYEENSLSGPADTSGSKNAIQAIGSAVTYLQRYTLKAALGLAAAYDDDAVDTASNAQQRGSNGATAKAPAYPNIDADQHEKLIEKIAAVEADATQFCKIFGIGSTDKLPKAKYAEAIARLDRYAERKKKAQEVAS